MGKKRSTAARYKQSAGTVAIDTLERQRELFRAMPPALRVVAKTVRNCLNRLSEFEIRRAWELGRYLDGIVSDTSGKYGDDPLSLLSAAIDYGRGHLLKLLHFYRDFPPDLLEWVLQQRMRASGRSVTLSRLFTVLTVADLKDRKVFLQQMFDNDWSVDELAEAIRKSLQRQPHGGGRPVSVPVRLEGKLDNLDKVLAVLLRNDRLIWRHEQHGILATLRDMPPDRITPAVMDKLDRAASRLAQVLETLQASVAELQQARVVARQRLLTEARQSLLTEAQQQSDEKKSGSSSRQRS